MLWLGWWLFFHLLVALVEGYKTVYLWTFIPTTDIHQRSQTSYTVPSNGCASHGAQFGGPWVFADHTRKNKRKANAFTIFARRAALYVWLSLRPLPPKPQIMQVTYTHMTNRDYFDYRNKLKTPNLSPIPGSRWCRFWDLWCITVIPTQWLCVLGTWCFPM